MTIANLFAAAPDLLAALVKAEDLLDDFLSLSPGDEATDDHQAVLVMVRAAIAKAEGHTS